MSTDHDQSKDIKYINDNLTKLETAMNRGFDEIKTQLNLMGDTFVRRELFEILEDRTTSLESFNKWFIRTVVGSVVIALLVALTKTLI